jgi:cell division septal protein FtsQ
VRRVALALVVVAIAAVAVYWFALRDSATPTASTESSRPVAQIGEGKQVLIVAADGKVIGTASGKSSHLPVLPLKERPKGDRVRGHVREQVNVLAAAPRAFRRSLARVEYGEAGVDVEFTSGIEIRFGDDRGVRKKWKAAAAVLADPSVTVLSYVDVHAPTRPTVGGEKHELPPA